MIALSILHTYFNLGVYLVILLIIGTLGRIYAKVVPLLLFIKTKLEDAYVQSKGLIFQIINVCNACLQNIGIQHQKIVKYVLKHFSLTSIGKPVFVQLSFRFYRILDAYHAILQIIGMTAENNVLHVQILILIMS